jgi:hypothetical protein
MAYIINRYNGTVLTTVEDGTVNQTAELKFIGKNFAGYGEAQNENFLFLLENFAGSGAPTRPISGMLWFDSSTSKIKVYDGAKWKTTGGAEVDASAPTGLVEGELWWNNATNQLYSRNSSSEWVLIGPQGAGLGVTQMQSLTLTDTVGNTHAVIASTIEDDIVYITSTDEFTIASSNAVTGFDLIKQGLTLVNTTAATAGVTSSEHVYWGTASNAARLNGKLASEYVTAGDVNFTTGVTFGDAGITLGNDEDLIINIDTDGVTPVIKLVRDELRFNSSSNVMVAAITATGILPGADNTFMLGNSSNKWNAMYANSFVGTATQADTLKVASSYRSASTAATSNSIAARDSSGNLSAIIFNGTSTTARYADLAEKYSTGVEHPVGTAMSVCIHSGHEVCPSTASNRCIGVISLEPAFMMNSEAEGQYVGLKGRVPVRVTGPVNKGQSVYAMAAGVCSTITTSALVGIALETNTSASEKLVECVLAV